MYKMLRVLVFCTLLLSTLAKQENEQSYYEKAGDFARCWGLPITATVGAVMAAPVVLPAMGFLAGAAGLAVTTNCKAVVGGVSVLAACYYRGCKDPDCYKNK